MKNPRILFICILIFSTTISCDNNNNTPNPSISEIQPESGPPGTVVTISGSDFVADLSSITVIFNETEGMVISASESQIKAEVPENAKSGPVQVSVKNETVTGPQFTVEAKAPVINSIDPESGSVGTEVLITGMNFSTNQSENIITFNGVQAQVLESSEVELLTEVPEGASDGPVEVTVSGKTAVGPDFDYTPILEEKILFVMRSVTAEVDDDADILSIDPDGSNQQKLFDTPDDEAMPVVSNEGTKIVYRVSDASNNFVNDLYISDIDGTSINKLTDLPEFIFSPSFTPDDSQILFSHGTEDDAEIYIVNADGTGLLQITDDDAANYSPEMSPDGSKILYSSNIDGDFEIYTMDIDGNNVQQLTDDDTYNRFAKWMPNGTEIVFHSEREGIYGDIYRMEADGSNVRRITNKNEGATFPHPSPDGAEILFMKYRDLHIINSDGSGVENQITNNPNRNNFQIGFPDWAFIEEK